MANRKRYVAQFAANVFERDVLQRIYVSFLIKAHDEEDAYNELVRSKKDFYAWINSSSDVVSACVYIYPMPQDDLVMLTQEIPEESAYYSIKGDLDVRKGHE